MNVDINILMLGARECGKSSLLASMFYGLKDLKDKQLYLHIDDSVDSAEMLTRREHLVNIFKNRTGDTWRESTHSGTKGLYNSLIEATLCEHLTFKLNVMEVPGEEFKKQITPKTIKTISQTQVFMIVIDTPWLMEKGRIGIRHNEVELISELLISIFSKSDKNEDKLLLFIPVKCEKYYNEGRIADVNERIKEVYGELTEHLTLFEHTTVYITPALTLGNLEFDHFEENENGEEHVIYKYTGEANYAPRHTEQPLLYVMNYILASINREQEIKKPGFWNKVGNTILASLRAIDNKVF